MTTNPVIRNPKNEYALYAKGSKVRFFTSYLSLVTGPDPEQTFKFANDSNPNTEEVDLAGPLKIYDESVVWARDSDDNVVFQSRGYEFTWLLKPLVPIKSTDQQFEARIMHRPTDTYIGFFEREVFGETKFVGRTTAIREDDAAVFTVINRSL